MFQLSYTFNASVVKLQFCTSFARLLVLNDDGYIHLLEINNLPNLTINRICSSSDEDRSIFQQIQTLCLLRNQIDLFIGLTDGNIYKFDLNHFLRYAQPIIPVDAIEQMSVVLLNISRRTSFFVRNF